MGLRLLTLHLLTTSDFYSELEQKRTRTSLSLSEEKKVLKEIGAGERDKRALQDRINHDKKIDSRKVSEKKNSRRQYISTTSTILSLSIIILFYFLPGSSPGTTQCS